MEVTAGEVVRAEKTTPRQQHRGSRVIIHVEAAMAKSHREAAMTLSLTGAALAIIHMEAAVAIHLMWPPWSLIVWR